VAPAPATTVANSSGTTAQAATPVTPVSQTQTAPSPASIVVSQEPAPGHKVLAGAAINFVVQ
jgi:hypothetical protein